MTCINRKLSSPNTSFESSFDEERCTTPTLNSSKDGLLDTEELAKPCIGPRNLMNVSYMPTQKAILKIIKTLHTVTINQSLVV